MLGRGALLACLLLCVIASASAVRSPLYVMQTPKSWALSNDTTTEENVPGLEPTDGFAINATMPNLEPLAPVLNTFRPAGPIVKDIMRTVGMNESLPKLPGHELKNRTSLTLLKPSAEAILKLPFQLWRSPALRNLSTSPLPTGQGSVKAAGLDSWRPKDPLGVSVIDRLARNMQLTRMVPYQHLSNLTRLTTKLGEPVTVVVSPDGRTKWLQTSTSKARIVVPDHGRPLIPIVTFVVDSFLIPASFSS